MRVTRTVKESELPDDPEALKALLAQRDARIRQLELENRIPRVERFAPKSERRPSQCFVLDAKQQHLLFTELIEAAERVADEKRVEGQVEIVKPEAEAVLRRRKHFPPHLPVVRTSYEFPLEQRGCVCDATMETIGDEVTKELERLELSVLHEIARAKHACKACACGVKLTPGFDRVIDKGIAPATTRPTTVASRSTRARASTCRARCCARARTRAANCSGRSRRGCARTRWPRALSRPTKRRSSSRKTATSTRGKVACGSITASVTRSSST